MSTANTVAKIPDDNIADIGDYKANSLWRLTLRRLLRQRSALVGLSILGLLFFLAIFAPFIAPYEPNQVLIGVEDVRKRDAPCIHLLGCPQEQPQHIMGIDGNVRDVFSRMLYGTRISLRIGFTVVSVAVIIGITLGSVAGYAGGWIDNVIMRLMDVILAFPFFLLAIALVFVLGPSLTNAMLAISIVSTPGYARVIRATVLTVRESESSRSTIRTGRACARPCPTTPA